MQNPRDFIDLLAVFSLNFLLEKMKIAWKKNAKKESEKKRPLALNPNLPFEREEEEEEELELRRGDEKKRIHAEISSSSNQQLDEKQAAKSLESQGNQLAEVKINCRIVVFFRQI